LLSPSANSTALNIREKHGSVFVEGLSRSRVTSFDDLHALLEFGDQNRATASTFMNASSSRSHAALIINIMTPEKFDDSSVNEDRDNVSESTDLGSSASKNKYLRSKESCLVLVDLAGSERWGASGISLLLAGIIRNKPKFSYLEELI
jgi:kinesin family protein 5